MRLSELTESVGVAGRSPNMSPYRRRRLAALKHAESVYPGDVGLSTDFGCIIW